MKAILSVIAIASTAIAGCATTQASASRTPTDLATVENACAYVPDELRDGLLFGEHFEIASARVVHQRVGKQNVRRYVGAELFVPSKPGVSASYVAQVAQCQLARYATEGRAEDRDPLAVRGASVSVKERGTGFVVRITSPDRDAAKAIAERSVSL